MAGAITPTGGAPRPDPERVATIRYTLVDEPETCAAFAEPIRASLTSLNERALTETQGGDLNECRLLLDHIRDRLTGLNPAQLEPRKGLSGLFDSRGKRLKAFRAAYGAAASALGQSSADIGDRAGALARRNSALESLWTETRDAITELDAHIAAARGWLSNEALSPSQAVPTEQTAVEAETDTSSVVALVENEAEPVIEAMAVTAEVTEAASSETTLPPDTDSAPSHLPESEATALADPLTPPVGEPASIVSLPHPLETRLATLEALRTVAIARLPLLRAAQNADCRTPAALKQVCEGVEGWRADWLDALGLASKKQRKVHPDRRRLTDASTALTDRIEVTSRELAAAQARRLELKARTAGLPSTAPMPLAA